MTIAQLTEEPPYVPLGKMDRKEVNYLVARVLPADDEEDDDKVRAFQSSI